ncbi:splicing factor U2af large subunit B-like protein isoform X3 [Tanacetum coccineum]
MITDMMNRNNSTTFWVISIDSTRRKIYRVSVILLLQRTSHTSPKQRLKTSDDVVNVYINHEKKLVFVKMRSVEEASNAMALDGIIFKEFFTSGAPVKVRRPSDYNPSLAATLGPSQPNPNLNLEAQVRELLESFGARRGFDLVKDRQIGNSKDYVFCVCVYQDLSITYIACAALNGIKMGDKTLTDRQANQGQTQPKSEQESVLLHAQQQIALQVRSLIQFFTCLHDLYLEMSNVFAENRLNIVSYIDGVEMSNVFSAR